MYSRDLDFKSLRDIPPVSRNREILQVSISPRGRFSISKAVKRRMGECADVRCKVSPDCRYLVFFPEDVPNIHFSPKGNYMTHKALARQLEENGIALPAAYVMEWDEEHRAWVGRCQELSAPPVLSELAGKRAGRCAARRAS